VGVNTDEEDLRLFVLIPNHIQVDGSLRAKKYLKPTKTDATS
jgi:hypothetical protein